VTPAEVPAGYVADVYEFLRYVKDAGVEPGFEWTFRGHEDATWELQSKIDRAGSVRWRSARMPPWSREEHEKWLLKEFAKRARPFTGPMARYGWDLIAIGQHHGLTTRLLDWTTNPLAALLFAVESRSATDSAVWFYKHQGKSSVSWRAPLDVTEISSFDPPHVSPRITVQSARFTVHPEGRSAEADWPGLLIKKVIPRRARPFLRLQLRNLGINRAVLFPDLDGIAADLNRVHGYQDDEGMDCPDDRKRFGRFCEDLGPAESTLPDRTRSSEDATHSADPQEE
jgi:hypothetical protein